MMRGGVFMVERKQYLEQLKKWKDQQVVKVITGIRRCGKSTLLMMYQEYLKKQIKARPGEKISNIPPRIANCPGASTCPVLSYPRYLSRS